MELTGCPLPSLASAQRLGHEDWKRGRGEAREGAVCRKRRKSSSSSLRCHHEAAWLCPQETEGLCPRVRLAGVKQGPPKASQTVGRLVVAPMCAQYLLPPFAKCK